jgi:Fe-S-cluster containining protein
MTARTALPLLNAKEATFECTYGRGCAGICCQNGRPGLYENEIELLEANLWKVLVHLRPAARAVIEEQGLVTRRIRGGTPLVPVVDGWCAFFNDGCVLHKLGAAEGDKHRYKPIQCSLFPLLPDEDGNWYVRQQGYKGEPWNLFCLAPGNSSVPAVESLREELALAARIEYGSPAEAPASEAALG